MCCPVNVYCDRDISCIVIVTYHVLISVLLVSYVVSIQCRVISLRFTSIVKVSNSSLYCCFCLGLGPWPRLEDLIEDQLLRRTPQIVTTGDRGGIVTAGAYSLQM